MITELIGAMDTSKSNKIVRHKCVCTRHIQHHIQPLIISQLSVVLVQWNQQTAARQHCATTFNIKCSALWQCTGPWSTLHTSVIQQQQQLLIKTVHRLTFVWRSPDRLLSPTVGMNADQQYIHGRSRHPAITGLQYMTNCWLTLSSP